MEQQEPIVPWWDSVDRLGHQLPNRQPLHLSLNMDRSTFLHFLTPLTHNTTLIANELVNYEFRTHEGRARHGNNRAARLSFITDIVPRIRKEYTLRDWTWNRAAPDELFMTEPDWVLAQHGFPTIVGQNAGVAAANQAMQALDAHVVGTVLTRDARDAHDRLRFDVGREAATAARAIEQRKMLVFQDQEVFQIAKHFLLTDTLGNVTTTTEFVQGLAQRFHGIYRHHVNQIDHLFVIFLKHRILKIAVKNEKEALDTYSFAAASLAPEINWLDTDMNQFGSFVAKAASTLSAAVESTVPEEHNHTKELLSGFFGLSYPDEDRVAVSGQSLARVSRLNVGTLRSMRSMQLNNSPIATDNGGGDGLMEEDSDDDDDYEGDEGEDVNMMANYINNNAAGGGGGGDVNNINHATPISLVDSEGILSASRTLSVEYEDYNAEGWEGLAAAIGLNGIMYLMKETSLGQKACSIVVNKKMIDKLILQLRRIIMRCVQTSAMSENKIKSHLLDPLNTLLKQISTTNLGKKPLGKDKDFKLLEMKTAKFLRQRLIRTKDPLTGKIGVFYHTEDILTLVAELSSTHRIIGKLLEKKYPNAEDIEDGTALTIDLYYCEHCDGTHLGKYLSEGAAREWSTVAIVNSVLLLDSYFNVFYRVTPFKHAQTVHTKKSNS